MRHKKEHLWEIKKTKKKKVDKGADQNLREKLGPNFIKKKISPAINALACKSFLVFNRERNLDFEKITILAGKALISQWGPWGVDLCIVVKLNISC